MKPGEDRPLVYLIDASVYVFRAWFSIPDSMTNQAGEPCNAAYGFANFLADLLRRTKPAPVMVAFDESLSSSIRNDIYPDYKANRPPAPVDLKRQFAWCRELCKGLGLPDLASDQWEADDLIGTWSAQANAAGHGAVIVSRDKDLAQLVGAHDQMWDFAADRRIDADGVEKQFGVRPDQIAEYLALMGDKVDNIPGVSGVGAKAASALLQHFGTLDEIYARIDEVLELNVRGNKRIRACLERDEAQARMSLQLTRIPRDLDIALPPLQRQPGDGQRLDAVCEKLGFGSGLRGRLAAL